MYKTFVPAVLALSLVACGTTAPNPPPAGGPAPVAAAPRPTPAVAPPAAPANAVNAASIQALKAMGAYLQSLKRFRVTTELTGEVVLADGQKLQHTATADIDVLRPNKLRARMFSARSERVIFFDGQRVTMFMPQQKYYSTVDFAGNVDSLVTRLESRYGVEIPLSDLFLWGTDAAPLDRIDSAMNAGQDFIGNDLCDHYAFRQGNYDWQIWIKAGSQPLPRKLVIVNRADEARPQSMSLIDWNLKPGFREDAFRFAPPAGTKQVELRALDAK
ncbi:DUF2092 domain-containing protein [Variovorax sp. J22P168]|uniref:DUF2092 domain-containing protein n=1 Tax=Variovorax jilinensis TaxID=3053513 RepID=UPI002575E82B|nr:DUF2092 domain-containing protein [Variovorax sp. J22P168]MDM0013381.1 DUF2092 domain-containing protein [Variovorax sp. J22P168]